MIGQNHHLKGVEMDDIDKKKDLPVHLILGASAYAQVKTETTPKIGKPGEPIADWTRFGWTILPLGSEPNLTNMFLTQTSAVDYENLCRPDVLGLQDHSVGDQDLVYEEFKEHLLRDPERWYETGLIWKGNHLPLPKNKPGSLKRLENLVKKLEMQPGKLAKIYDPLGLASPITLEGKMLYRQACELRTPLDYQGNIRPAGRRGRQIFFKIIEAPRSIAQYQEEITSINLHAFGDASSQGLSAAV